MIDGSPVLWPVLPVLAGGLCFGANRHRTAAPLPPNVLFADVEKHPCKACIFFAVVAMVKEITSKEEFDKILSESGDKLIVIDYTATWCG